MIFEEDFKIQLKDIEKGDHIKNIGILEMFENIAVHHADKVGHGIKDIEKTGVSWVLIDWKIKVLKRPQYGNNLHIATWSRTINGEMKKSYVYRDFELYDEKNLCVIGTSKWSLINVNTGRITKIEKDVIDKYKSEDKNVFNVAELDRIDVPEDFENEITYKVTRRDIDWNNHMHNLYYLDLAYEALPKNVYDKRPFNEFRIQYKREVKLNDIIKCKYACKNNNHIITIYNEDNTRIHAIITLK